MEIVNIRTQVIGIVISLLLLGGVVVSFYRIRLLSLNYALLWLLTSVVVLSLCVSPRLLAMIARWLSIGIPVNALYLIAILFAIVNLLALSVTLANQVDANKTLFQKLALLQERLERLERKG